MINPIINFNNAGTVTGNAQIIMAAVDRIINGNNAFVLYIQGQIDYRVFCSAHINSI